MSGDQIERVAKAPLGPRHPLPKERAAELAVDAWNETFVPALRTVPHPDNDPEGQLRAIAQRTHLQLLIGTFARMVGEAAVAYGLYDDLGAFFDHVEAAAAADAPASAGGDRGENGEGV